jgi:hypothetical protein
MSSEITFYKGFYHEAILLFLTSASLLLSNKACCQETLTPVASIQEQTVDERIYVSAESIQITNNGIFVNIQNELYRVLALYTDSIGVYVHIVNSL